MKLAQPPAMQENRGPGGGAFATWGLNEHLGLQGELLYVSKGFSYGKSEATDQQGNVLGTYEILEVADYLEVPLLLRAAGVSPSGRLSPAVVIGPTISFKVRERHKHTGALEGSEKDDR